MRGLICEDTGEMDSNLSNAQGKSGSHLSLWPASVVYGADFENDFALEPLS
jgi:hypothetical protein